MDVFLVENRVAGAGFIRAGGAVRGSPRSDAAGRPWRSAGFTACSGWRGAFGGLVADGRGGCVSESVG
jgi:hypothetical protein